MTSDQALIAVPLLNSYAHQYLGLPMGDVAVAGGEKDEQWVLMVATKRGKDEYVEQAKDFDDAKAMIDELQLGSLKEASGDDN